MTKTEIIEQTFALNSASMSFLLMLRIILDEPISHLNSDVEDLYLFPERLDDSYRDEWISYIKNRLVRDAFRHKNWSIAKNLNHFIEQQYQLHGDTIAKQYDALNRVIKQVESLKKASNIVCIPSRYKRSTQSLTG